MINLTNYFIFRIKDHKFPDMLSEDRYWGHNMGLTQDCLDEGLADDPLAEIDLIREDVEVVPDQNKINEVCTKYLNDTDWYVARLSETGKAIPEEVLQKRQEARDAITGET